MDTSVRRAKKIKREQEQDCTEENRDCPPALPIIPDPLPINPHSAILPIIRPIDSFNKSTGVKYCLVNAFSVIAITLLISGTIQDITSYLCLKISKWHSDVVPATKSDSDVVSAAATKVKGVSIACNTTGQVISILFAFTKKASKENLTKLFSYFPEYTCTMTESVEVFSSYPSTYLQDTTLEYIPILNAECDPVLVPIQSSKEQSTHSIKAINKLNKDAQSFFATFRDQFDLASELGLEAVREKLFEISNNLQTAYIDVASALESKALLEEEIALLQEQLEREQEKNLEGGQEEKVQVVEDYVLSDPSTPSSPYEVTKIYRTGDIVTHSDGLFQCVLDCQGKPPFYESAFWNYFIKLPLAADGSLHCEFIPPNLAATREQTMEVSVCII
jgi:hypothetical protein